MITARPAELTADASFALCKCRYLEALGVQAVAFGSLVEAANAGHGAAKEASDEGPEVLLLAVDVAPRADLVRKKSGCGPRTEGEGEGEGAGAVGAGVSGFSPGVGEISEVAKRGWRRCLPPQPPFECSDIPEDLPCLSSEYHVLRQMRGHVPFERYGTFFSST